METTIRRTSCRAFTGTVFKIKLLLFYYFFYWYCYIHGIICAFVHVFYFLSFFLKERHQKKREKSYYPFSLMGLISFSLLWLFLKHQ